MSFKLPYISGVIFLMLLYSCKREHINVIDNLRGKIIICGHGGAGFQSYVNPYPSNSFLSVQRALEGLNADGVEVDIQMTKDKELYLYHDEDLNVATNCSGCISGLSVNEIKDCRYNNTTSLNVFQDIKIARLEDVLSNYVSASPQKYFYFDMRLGNSCDAEQSPDKDTIADRVVKMISKYSGQYYMPVIAGDTAFLNRVQKLDPSINLIYEDNDPAIAVATCLLRNYQGIIARNENITKEQVKEAHLKKLEVIIFNVKVRQGTIDAVNKSPDVIQTDNLPLLIEVLNDLN